MADPIISAADLRAMRARHRVSVYELAAAAKIAPSALYAMLNDRRPLDAQTAERIARAIQKLVEERHSNR